MSSGSEVTMKASSSFSSSTRSLSELHAVRLGIDLVSAARRTVFLLRAVSCSPCLHHAPALAESVRRYDELWMPMISDAMTHDRPPMILPPLDIEWVWFCHTLNPVGYRKYCESRFSKLIGKAPIFDEENEEYALTRCREIWIKKYPDEPFENEAELGSGFPGSGRIQEEVLGEVKKQSTLYCKFSEPYRSEIVYLIAAMQRYRAFVSLLHRNNGVPLRLCHHLVPASDVLLMLLTHQSYPTVYAEDLKDSEEEMRSLVVSVCDNITKSDIEETKNLWEATFDQPYEKAGAEIARIYPIKPPVHWQVSDADLNTRYKSLSPRFLLEVCVFVKLKVESAETREEGKGEALRIRVVRGHRELKLEESISGFSNKSWRKAWNMYCEFGTKGLAVDLRRLGGGFCFKTKTVEESATFHWNSLLGAPSLSLHRQLGRRVKIVASTTPPVQAPYLLKCVPDRVTDDSGAMISDVILRMNQYRPQEGRWLSRSVLDHAGRECFVIRTRVGQGFWRRGGEAPSAVKWEERIIEIREGSWSYVAGSMGRAPEKVVGTATPKQPPQQRKAVWEFSTGDELSLQCEPSASNLGLSFSLTSPSSESTAKLLKGRKMQYRMGVKENQSEKDKEDGDDKEEEEEEEGFLTLVRFTEEEPSGRATALLNWKLLAVEFVPEEDAVLVLLLCVSILRSVSEIKKEDLGRLLVRRRLKEARQGTRDWGSVALNPPHSSIHLQPWYLRPEAVLLSDIADRTAGPAGLTYSPEEGSDQLYRRWIFN